MGSLLQVILLLFFTSFCSDTQLYSETLTSNSTPVSVYTIPITGQISKAQLFILRRGLKQALQEKIDLIVLKIDTPGGDLKTTLDIMDALANYTGTTLTYIDNEAISAGAYISAATDEIYLKPDGLIGAAAVIQATGKDIEETAKQKINSYLRAKVRSLSKNQRYRSDVIRAMMDKDFKFEIDGVLIKDKDELLTLTASEAIKTYGNPPEPLLAQGIYESLEALLKAKSGERGYQVREFQISWSEDLAKWLNKITPLLLGIGILCLFIEFKTPGFGLFGITGITLLLIIFAGNYVAGLAGNEAVLFFILGIILFGIEIFIFPGIIIIGALGAILIVASLLWSMADIWPTKDFKLTPEIFIAPLINLAIGFAIAITGIYILGRYVLKSWFWEKLVLSSYVTGTRKSKLPSEYEEPMLSPNIGDEGVVINPLNPTGVVDINGERYQAFTNIGFIDKGKKVKVTKVKNFAIVVKEINS